MKYIIANWKSNKNFSEVKEWFDVFLGNKHIKETENIKIIICPPFPFLMYAKKRISQFDNISICAQDISRFPGGSYTGEVNIGMLTNIIDFVLIGHNERRKYFSENDYTCETKIKLALENDITPILCISSHNQIIPKNISFLAYEPEESIGTGQPKDLNHIIDFYNKLENKPSKAFIYGGSVFTGNIKQYIENSNINGLLIGNASLNPKDFSLMLKSIK